MKVFKNYIKAVIMVTMINIIFIFVKLTYCFVIDGSGTPATFKTEFFQTLVGQKTHVSTGTTFRNF